ncbi:MAG: PQQ-dependent sugar dehydrogenase [Candidatus Micrarchaeota archaeon]
MKAHPLMLSLLLLGCIQGAQPPDGGGTSRPETVASGLEVPWAMDFLPGGDIIFTERPGRIRLIRNGTLLEEPAAVLDVAAVGESGLLGIAADPDFNSSRAIFVYYTYFENRSGKMQNRISRLTLDGDEAGGEKVLLDGIPGGRGDQGFHNGGRLRFGPDGLLYAATGDGGVPGSAQDLNSLGGKILRLSKDGSIPPDNPFPGSPVYSYGHRNPQGLAWHAASGGLFATEHGPIGNDELNLIEAGRNYSWPDLQCTADPAVLCFSETIAPSGAAFHGNDLYVAALRGTQIRKIRFDDSGKVLSQEIFLTGYGRMRDVAVKDGYLYALTSNRDGRAVLTGPQDDLMLRVKLT